MGTYQVGVMNIPIKILLYQVIAVLIIWSGMAFFFNDLYDSGRIIFYVVTSWLLFLIVLLLKALYRKKFQNEDEHHTND